VATYWSGIVDETDLVYQGGFPGPLRKTLGIWSEEIDALHDGQTNAIKMGVNNKLGVSGEYEAYELCDIIHLEGAEALAYYQEDFYAESPELTVNKFGNGKAYYIASRNIDQFHTDFYKKIVDEAGVKRVVDVELPEGVTAQSRTDGEYDYVFLSNYSREVKQIELSDAEYVDLVKNIKVSKQVELQPFGISLFKRKAQ